MLKKLICLLLIVVMTAMAAGCDNGGASGDAGARGEVIGSVNGVDIYKAEYDTYRTDYYLSYLQNGYSYFMNYMGIDLLDEESAAEILAELEMYAWELVVQSELILQMAEADYGITYDSEFLEKFLTWGAYRGMCVQTVNSQLQAAVRAELLAAKTVSEKDTRAAYDADPSRWDSRLSSHILLMFDAEDGVAQAQALEQAEDLIAQLDAGADFAELARENSHDGSSGNGGLINYYIRADGSDVGNATSFYPEYVEGLYSLSAVGEYALVQSSAGYHIIKLDDIRDSYEDSAEAIAASLKTVSDEEVSAAVNAKLEALHDAADIVENVDFTYYDPQAAEQEAADEAAGETADNEEGAADAEGAAE